jgi:hypothetical protein
MQELLVTLIVLAALVYALWAFMPARWRLALARRLGLGERASRMGGCHGSPACNTWRACGGAAGRENSRKTVSNARQ